ISDQLVTYSTGPRSASKAFAMFFEVQEQIRSGAFGITTKRIQRVAVVCRGPTPLPGLGRHCSCFQGVTPWLDYAAPAGAVLKPVRCGTEMGNEYAPSATSDLARQPKPDSLFSPLSPVELWPGQTGPRSTHAR